MAPIIAALAGKGLNLIASAVMQKGQQAVEKTLGVKLDAGMSDEQALRLKQLEFEHEETLHRLALEDRKIDLEGERVAQDAVTKRWEADLHSDNKLSKNIRPGVLVYLLLAVTLFAVLDSFPQIGFEIKQHWVDLLSGALQLVLAAYFAGRTVEKGINMWQGKK